MQIITTKRLKEAYETHPDAKQPLLGWIKLVKKIDVGNFVELKASIPIKCDRVGNFVVFDIGGNNYRLIVYIDYIDKKVFIRRFLTHAEYDKNNWRNDAWYQE